MAVVEFFKRVATLAGRSLEFALTGQAGFTVINSELAVTDITRGKRMLAEARAVLAREFRIEVREPVLLALFSGKDFSPASMRYRLRGSIGCYQPHRLGEQGTHTIQVLTGLTRGRFQAIVAHEIVHAYEREASILTTDRGLREGFARWVEYKMLARCGETDEMQKLTRLKKWSSGRSVNQLLEIERERGVAGVLAYVHTIA